MSTSNDKPKPFITVWAEKGLKTGAIPEKKDPNSEKDQFSGKASMEEGFPRITMMSAMDGGVPPWGQDHNQILNQITDAIQWTQAGGCAFYDGDLCNKIGGYPIGTILQGDDPARPWVFWQSVINNNKQNPSQLDVSKTAEQNGWRRYPIISARDGSPLYYDKQGQLDYYTAELSIYYYVSWSQGNDDTGKGTRYSPYKTIDKAVSVSPSSGQVYIKILDVDSHYILGRYDTAVQDINLYSTGNFYTEDDKITIQPIQTISESINIGIRSIIIQPYNNPRGYPENYSENDIVPDGWDDLINYAQQLTIDGWWGYCLTDEALKSKELTRPTIYKMWCYDYIKQKDGFWITAACRYCGIDGVEGFNVGFLGCRIVNYNLDNLNNIDKNIIRAFERIGGNFFYNGCIIDNLALNKGKSVKYSMGGSDLKSSRISFRRANCFIDYEQKKKGLYAGVNSSLEIVVNREKNSQLANTGLLYIDNNAQDFLAKKTSYTNETLKILKDPSSRYAYLTINVDLS